MSADQEIGRCRMKSVISIFFEPTDRRKAIKPLQSKQYRITYASPNISELRAMAKFLQPNTLVEETHDVTEITLLCEIVSQYVQVLIVTMGDKGVITVSQNIKDKNETDNKILEVRNYAVDKLNNVDNVSGAGDCFASGFVHGVLLGYSEPYCVSLGFEAAKSALLCENTVPLKFQIPSNMIGCDYKNWFLK